MSHLRYLAGESEDMIETKDKKREGKTMGHAIEVGDMTHQGEVLFADTVTDEEAQDGEIFTLNPEFIRDIALIFADIVIKHVDPDLEISQDQERYIHEQLVEGIEFGLDSGPDFSVDSYEKWWMEENGVDPDLLY